MSLAVRLVSEVFDPPFQISFWDMGCLNTFHLLNSHQISAKTTNQWQCMPSTPKSYNDCADCGVGMWASHSQSPPNSAPRRHTPETSELSIVCVHFPKEGRNYSIQGGLCRIFFPSIVLGKWRTRIFLKRNDLPWLGFVWGDFEVFFFED